MNLAYVLKRLGMFALVVWLATTINFFLPRLGSGDPVRQKMMQQAQQTVLLIEASKFGQQALVQL